jgi:hypothetical protein
LSWGHWHHHVASRAGIASTVTPEAIATTITLTTFVKAHEFFNTTRYGIQGSENFPAAQFATTTHGVARISIASDSVASSVVKFHAVAVIASVGRLT